MPGKHEQLCSVCNTAMVSTSYRLLSVVLLVAFLRASCRCVLMPFSGSTKMRASCAKGPVRRLSNSTFDRVTSVYKHFPIPYIVVVINIEPIRERFSAVAPFLDERGRRLLAAAEAFAAGYGEIAAVAMATGIAPSTIGRGLKELA